jgi:hypothetical protein
MWLRYGRLGLLLRLHSRGTGGARKKDELRAEPSSRAASPAAAIVHR